MHSQDKRLLVLGDSNVGMIKDLMNADGSILGYQDVSFWFQTGSAFNTIGFSDGIVSGRSKDSMPPTTLADYDHILWSGGRFRTSQVFEAIMSKPLWHYSIAFVRQIVREYLENLPAARSLRSLRSQFAGSVTILPTPLRGICPGMEPNQTAYAGTESLYPLIWSIYNEIAATLDATLISTPDEMIVDGFLIDARYNLTSDDDLHKNAAYARRLLNGVSPTRTEPHPVANIIP
ncbi:hypothetical protein [Paracoccus aminophilus]|uniref:SGNH hydrolase-type esterase domain-containing protein n=1 Tax=Paracoccus aminophilus JCM 7686 TaxID=1367847 RepID=S5YV67_PARAH|nr:hypothetical protein [Paracoccus aminophilus]AGT09071.1 hypothetical protein JCM7686_1970 [Paracoccus aminophilus JCM 7686]